MKNLIQTLGVILLLQVGGCTTDPCKDISCANGGTCIDGDCQCPEGFFGNKCEIQLDACTVQNCVESNTASCVVANNGKAICQCEVGFEGQRCELKWEDRYPGNYTAMENCNGVDQSFGMEIETGPSFNQITLVNFHDQAGTNTSAKIVGNLERVDLFDIYVQFMPFGSVQGFGKLENDDEIFLTYTILNGPDTLSCIATLTKI